MTDTFLSTLSLLIQMALVIVGAWYTVETRALRKQNQTQIRNMQDQLEYLRSQTKILLSTSSPYFVVSIRTFERAKQLTKENPGAFSNLEVCVEICEERKEKCNFVVVLDNQNENMALDIDCVVFSESDNGFYSAHERIIVMAGKESHACSIDSQRYAIDEMIGMMADRCGIDSALLNQFRTLEASSIVCLYRDAYGRLVAQVRGFTLEEGGDVRYLGNQLLEIA